MIEHIFYSFFPSLISSFTALLTFVEDSVQLLTVLLTALCIAVISTEYKFGFVVLTCLSEHFVF